MNKTAVLLGLVLILLTLNGCGGSNDVVLDPPPPSTIPLIEGAHLLAFSAISTARLDAPISGINVAIKLPVGLTVMTSPQNPSQLDSATVIAGRALTGTNLAYGSYSASSRKVQLAMVTTSDSFRYGQFLLLAFTVQHGAVVSEADIVNLNSVYPYCKAVGYDATSHSSVVLTNSLNIYFRVIQ